MAAEAVLDNDIVQKLGRLELISDFGAFLDGLHYSSPFRRLATSRYALRTNRPAPSHWPDTKQQTAVDNFLTGRCDSITISDPELTARLAAVPGIDVGEVQLFAYALEHATATVFTGDKTAIRALVQATSLQDITAALSGRIATVEMVLLGLASQVGVAALRDANAAQGGTVDTALRLVCSGSSDDDSFRAALDSYVRDLRRESGALLSPDF